MLALLLVVSCSPWAEEDWIVERFDLRDSRGLDYAVYVFVPRGAAPGDDLPYVIALDGDILHERLRDGLARRDDDSSAGDWALVSIGFGGDLSEAMRRRSLEYVPAVGDVPGEVGPLGEFLESRVLPELESRYPALSSRTEDRVLSGHSLGGLAVVCMALERPALASACIAVSPAFWYGDLALLRLADEAKERGLSLDKLFMAVGEYDTSSLILTADAALQGLATRFPGLLSSEITVPGADHYGAVVPGFLAGLEWIDARR